MKLISASHSYILNINTSCSALLQLQQSILFTINHLRKIDDEEHAPHPALAPEVQWHEYRQEQVQWRPCPLVADVGHHCIKKIIHPLGIDVIPGGKIPIDKPIVQFLPHTIS